MLSMHIFFYLSTFRVPKDVSEPKKLADEAVESTLDLQPYGEYDGFNKESFTEPVVLLLSVQVITQGTGNKC